MKALKLYVVFIKQFMMRHGTDDATATNDNLGYGWVFGRHNCGKMSNLNHSRCGRREQEVDHEWRCAAAQCQKWVSEDGERFQNGLLYGRQHYTTSSAIQLNSSDSSQWCPEATDTVYFGGCDPNGIGIATAASDTALYVGG